MRFSRGLTLTCALLAALAMPPARSIAADEVVVEGEVVDLACFIPRGDKGRGPDHQECAEMCAEGGQPLGLMVDDKETLLLVEDHQKPAPYKKVKELAGKNARIGGQKVSRGGINAIVVHEANAKE